MRLADINLPESFDSNIPGTLVRATADTFTKQASIGGRKIVFRAQSYDTGAQSEEAWSVEFIEKMAGSSTFGKTGSGSEMQVFAFVIESVKELVSRYKPAEITFASHKEDGNRSSLYKRMISRISIPGYILSGVDSDAYTDTFRIVRADLGSTA